MGSERFLVRSRYCFHTKTSKKLLTNQSSGESRGEARRARTPLPSGRRKRKWLKGEKPAGLPPFSLIRDFGKQNTRGNVSKISVSLACYRQTEILETIRRCFVFHKSRTAFFVRLGSSYSSCKFLHLFRFVIFLPSCSIVVSYFLQTILIRLARVLCWQLVPSTGELTHPALSTNCKSDPPLWLVKRKWHFWPLSSAEPGWKWDSQGSWPEAFLFSRARRFSQLFASQISK